MAPDASVAWQNPGPHRSFLKSVRSQDKRRNAIFSFLFFLFSPENLGDKSKGEKHRFQARGLCSARNPHMSDHWLPP